ncbi:MAG TPA: hypothetical protein VHC19_29980 [Pirellulales bacterium]|jgi:hypothetical protein|nr:hypothetical protein [Pirellulales bacterium]
MSTKRFTIVAAIAVAAVSLAGSAQAQMWGGPYGGAYFGGMGYPGMGFGWGLGYGGAGSTAAGGFLLGSAAQTAAAGQYNLLTSMGEKNYQDAYEHWIDNQKKREETYFEMRRMNASYRAETRRPTPSMEKLISFSNSRIPARLTAEQWDPAKGEIRWPNILKREEFAPQREALDSLFVERVKQPYSTGLGTENYREVRIITDGMHDVLRTLIGEITPDEFIVGNKFLNSLAYEARFDPDLNIVKNK